MKKIVLCSLILISLVCSLMAIPTGKSMSMGDSYMMRAWGTEALYWNPARLNSTYQNISLPLINGGFQVVNNSLDLKTYNDFVSLEYLTAEDKEDFLDKIDEKLMLNTEGHYSIYGMTIKNFAFSTSAHYYGSASLSKKYLSLVLYGNEEEEYTFHKRNNNVAAISFVDLTFGMGDITIKTPKKLKKMPPIKFGFSSSILIGAADVRTKSYTGNFSSTLDGISATQDVTLGTGMGGLGFKSMLGIVSEPIPHLNLGLTLDNLFGFITWSGNNEDMHYNISIDSVYVSNLSDDLYVDSDSTFSAGSYSTKIPPELRFGSMYSIKQGSISMDYIQGFANSVMTSKRGRVAFGLELLPTPSIPINLGLSLGNKDYPWRMSYGIGFKTRATEFGIGFQCFESLLPGYTNKGLAFSSYLNIKI